MYTTVQEYEQYGMAFNVHITFNVHVTFSVHVAFSVHVTAVLM